MNQNRALVSTGFVVLAVVLMAGCGGSEGPPRGDVQGRLTLDGKALGGATVIFENPSVGVAQAATTDSDGKYEFLSYEAAGLPAASYKVTVSSGRFMQPGEEIPFVQVSGAKPVTPAAPVATVPAKYAKADSSGLSAEVKAGDNPPFDFDLKP